jgi:ribosomal protein L37E
MEYAKLETACLAHVDESYYYGAYCRACGHHARLCLMTLRHRLGENFPLRKVRDRLRCKRCGDRRKIVVTFLAPNQRTASLVTLFDKAPARED